jgi:hypothetical protein
MSFDGRDGLLSLQATSDPITTISAQRDQGQGLG